MTRYEQDTYDGLPEPLRLKYLKAIDIRAQKNSLLKSIINDVKAATECARRGENHWRLNQMRVNATNKEASFYPICPAHLLTESKRLFNQPIDMQDAYLDYTTPHYGPGGSVRQG